MSETIQGIFAGYVLSRRTGGFLSSNDERHGDVTLLGVQENGGFTHVRRGLMRASDPPPDTFTLAGIGHTALPGTMPGCRTGVNGGFCILYEFEATRLAVDFGLNTRIRFRAVHEEVMTAVTPGIIWDSTRVVGWRIANMGIAEVPAFTIPNHPNLEDTITYMTGQRDVLNDFVSGIVDVITEDSIMSTVSSAMELVEHIGNPNARQILFSIAVIRL